MNCVRPQCAIQFLEPTTEGKLGEDDIALIKHHKLDEIWSALDLTKKMYLEGDARIPSRGFLESRLKPHFTWISFFNKWPTGSFVLNVFFDVSIAVCCNVSRNLLQNE